MKKIILASLVILTLILAASPAMAAEPEKALIVYFITARTSTPRDWTSTP